MNKQNFKVFNELLDGVQVIKSDLTYAYLNEAAHQQLGLAQNVVDGSDFRTLCDGRGWNALLHLAKTCLKSNLLAGKY